jgi:hypothetical protein
VASKIISLNQKNAQRSNKPKLQKKRKVPPSIRWKLKTIEEVNKKLQRLSRKGQGLGSTKW